MSDTETLLEAALEVLNTADPIQKARLGEAAAKRWLQGEISVPFRQDDDLPIPNRPARLSSVKLVAPSLMPKLGKGGSLQSRLAMLHSLVHTESWAIDLSWDIIARFGRKESMPRDFFTDFVKVAQDEGRHFVLLARRLEELGSYYGAFPAHDGLWDSAIQTSNDLSARLAVEHCVHEASVLLCAAHLQMAREWPVVCRRFIYGLHIVRMDLIRHILYVRLDHYLITALVDRVDGEAMVGPPVVGLGLRWETWHDCCDELLGAHPDPETVYHHHADHNVQATFGGRITHRFASQHGESASSMQQTLDDCNELYSRLEASLFIDYSFLDSASEFSSVAYPYRARGLDVLPTTISRFRNGGDEDTANLLETVIYPEEITHCAAGVKWFTYLCQRKLNGHQDANISSVNGAPKEHSKQEAVNRSDSLVGDLEQPMKNSAKVEGGKQNVVIEAFHNTVRRYFRGPLKPPFNVEARKAAGFGPDWYEPLAIREVKLPD
ncbi:hypothetical protein IEQ34_006833 [Dendrobium chrysotoxum]|uniref:Ferritin-like superfamily n=1 Tax=Dendrobium chrysotoxum TaxID=161865 RepID=A0AAV7H6M5_DENCH|nr:hypothetical protein IEQ34_006833 [Dendrobium chrysotoxum]